jgi:1-deoxy-D-xylulose-5-phosphate synthase
MELGNNVSLAIAKIKHPETIAHYDFPFVKPLDESALHHFKTYPTIITIEDGTVKRWFWVQFSSLQHQYATTVRILGIPDEFIEHGTVAELTVELTLKALSNSFKFLK